MPRRPPPHRSTSVLSPSSWPSPCVRIVGSIAQAFFDQPVLNEPGDLIAVLVHHHHVRVALDARVGQVDEIKAAARGLEGFRISDAVLPDVLPARMLLGI